ncbi:hypothetical protein [Oleomonas cavernae]|uniref:hypothetical protein n=1 Tax=Oleomonas cavernae TaxID=2320859 RepID=UPI0011C4A403|nr:hypothetical protein [Oleomonas cavernae]
MALRIAVLLLVEWAAKQGRPALGYSIVACNTIGAIALKREDAIAALKKARELRDQNFWDIEIIDARGSRLDEATFARQHDLK